MGHITPEMLMRAYGLGVFPMSEHRDDPEIFWVDPKRRGVFPIDDFHISRSLTKRIRRGGFRVSLNKDFEGVLDGCADRSDTWINGEIRKLYIALHEKSQAHSIEVWSEDDRLIGGVYGVTLGAAFFGESMFSRVTDASKIALAYLTTHLSKCGFELFDTQFLTEHLQSLGAIELSRDEYHEALAKAVVKQADIQAYSLPSAAAVVQRRTQTS
ncbi:leucyl/phenylalanyl-tRNA--protein transferase [Cognatishimia activa]|uniref:Leucyl/phenylalanyl-tRNA--protein transferase n=1 Tax=Cognatishimia activa TaxID=1715691 RepID=A0A0P1INB7_9RHOB|nr:leucyl/phenylalanyl-tRNA--protein transferase [Cognatishimia activa]CUJ15503.1 Leucyl/phenylalanyl-tRNA--protein transferase [Cognatishimia activa]CUK25028.1 Leucyl/phenylalanyl-tRNA--protein transferase [Cognatishimia activa]